MRQYSHQPGVVSNASGNCIPTHVRGEERAALFLCIDFYDCYLNEIIKSQTYLWNTAMLHSSVTGAVGESEVNRCADDNQRWVITKALIQSPPNLRVREGLPSGSLNQSISRGMFVVLDWSCQKQVSF